MSRIQYFSSLLDADALGLLTTGGAKLIREIGMETVKTVVLEILSGRNLRDSTELLTRSRLAMLNVAMLKLFLEGESRESGFVSRLPSTAERILREGKLTKAERWLAQWMLGLTDKASQNVLRDDASLLINYREAYEEICSNVVANAVANYGLLSGDIQVGAQLERVNDLGTILDRVTGCVRFSA
jgi:hypothetical protein